MSLRFTNQFRFKGVTKKEVYDHLKQDKDITDFIIGYDAATKEVLGEMFTKMRIRIRVAQGARLKMDNGVQGEWIMNDNSPVDAAYIADKDPNYMVKGTRYEPSDVEEGAAGSIPEDLEASTVRVATECNIDPGSIQTMIKAIIEGIRTGSSMPAADSSQDDSLRKQIEERDLTIKACQADISKLKKEIDDLKGELEDEKEENEGELSRYKRELEALKTAEKQYKRKIEELELEVKRLGKQPAVPPPPIPVVQPIEAAPVTTEDVTLEEDEEEGEILEPSNLRMRMKEYYDSIFGPGASKIKPKQNINRLEIKVKAGRPYVIIDIIPIDKKAPVWNSQWKGAKIVTFEEGKRRIDQVSKLP